VLERDDYPPGVPCWVDTAQPDPEATVHFYGELFGWEFEDRMPADAPGRYYIAALRGRAVAGIGSLPDAAPPTAAWNTYIGVGSADDTAAKVTDAGGSALTDPFDVFDAGRMAVLADPSGAVFGAWQAKTRKGAQLVNEPGTWNWSDLNTRDPEGSKAFYGAVFGWETSRVDLGEGDGYTMWRLPGYGDFLERSEPGLRRRQAAQGAPAGFEDAIAWLLPMTNGGSEDVAPHWSVTFAVADTDAVADRAAQLGGTITVAPFDAGVVRVAVMRDPQGAAFSVNTFTPSG
jgi:predicted enzyme related to lactoylglutathione lyase